MDQFEQVYREHFAAVYQFALSATGRRDVAEELTTDAFIELHRRLDRISLDDLPAWLFEFVSTRAANRGADTETADDALASDATDAETRILARVRDATYVPGWRLPLAAAILIVCAAIAVWCVSSRWTTERPAAPVPMSSGPDVSDNSLR